MDVCCLNRGSNTHGYNIIEGVDTNANHYTNRERHRNTGSRNVKSGSHGSIDRRAHEGPGPNIHILCSYSHTCFINMCPLSRDPEASREHLPGYIPSYQQQIPSPRRPVDMRFCSRSAAHEQHATSICTCINIHAFRVLDPPPPRHQSPYARMHRLNACKVDGPTTTRECKSCLRRSRWVCTKARASRCIWSQNEVMDRGVVASHSG